MRQIASQSRSLNRVQAKRQRRFLPKPAVRYLSVTDECEPSGLLTSH
ncbi:MAG: hypothetical protein QOI97_4379 [Pseudomonas sp.]|jgi:hypothetical protein|nr:hypothetical protein [Pseudomonas sp.]